MNNNKENETNNNEVIKTSSNKKVIVLLLIIIIIMAIFIIILLNKRNNDTINNQPTNNNANTEETNSEPNNKKENNYKIEYKEETKEYKNSSGKVIIENKRNYPIITNEANPEAASKIEKYLKDNSDKSWEDLNKSEYVTNNDFVENYNYKVGITDTYTTEQSNNKYLSFRLTRTGSMGGVGWNNTNGYNFDYETGKLLEVKDVMDYDSHQNELYEYITSVIEKEYESKALWNNNIEGYWKDIVKKYMFGTGNWLFTNSGIKVFFAKYTLGPGSTGVVEAEIPIAKINNYLYDKYKY